MNRIELKEKAKKIFLSRYWLLVGIFAIIMAITGAVAGFSSGGSSLSSGFSAVLRDNGMSAEAGVALALIICLVSLIVCSLALIVSIFGTNIISVGAANVGLRAMRGEGYGIKDIFSGFKKNVYFRNVGGMALYTLFTGLAALVIIIPGTLLSIALAFLLSKLPVWAFVILYTLYMLILVAAALVPSLIIQFGLSRVPYLLAEDDSIKPMAAIKMSWEMMTGHKGEYFMLNLSFLGWELLNVITFGITGIFWSTPYMCLTLAGYHDELVSGYEGAEVVPEVIE